MCCLAACWLLAGSLWLSWLQINVYKVLITTTDSGFYLYLLLVLIFWWQASLAGNCYQVLYACVCFNSRSHSFNFSNILTHNCANVQLNFYSPVVPECRTYRTTCIFQYLLTISRIATHHLEWTARAESLTQCSVTNELYKVSKKGLICKVFHVQNILSNYFDENCDLWELNLISTFLK